MARRWLLAGLPLAFVWLTMCGNSGSSSSALGAEGGADSTSDDGTGGSSGSSSGGGSGGSSSSSGGGADGGRDAGDGGDGGIAVGASVLMYHSHANRDGFFIDPKITRTTAASFHLDTTFAGAMADGVYASPLYVEHGVKNKGTFYVATQGDDVYAFDEATGGVLWTKNVGTPASQSGAGCGNVKPIGITGTPAIDLATRLIVFDAATADASGNIQTHTIHALSIDDGSSKWSVDVSTLKDPTGLAFSPQPQNERGAVLVVGGVAYVVYGGHAGDCGDYHGWVVGVPLTGKGARAWATTVPKAGIWAPGGAASDGQSVFVATGNGADSSMTWAQSEGIFRLDPGPTFTGQPADYFAPYNWYAMDQGDVDISGSGPLVIDAPAIKPSALVLAQGKDGYLYLLDRANLGGVATSSQLANVGALKVSSGEISNGSAWATVGANTYVVLRPNGTEAGVGCPNGTSGDLVAVRLDPAAPSKMSVAWCAKSLGGGSPIITTSDGTKDGLVWLSGGDGAFSGDTGQLHAWDLATGLPVFDGGTTADKVTTTVHHFSTIAAVHGRIFVTGDKRLYAFGP